MEKEFIPYELALRMKQLGFDEPCFNLYHLNRRELMYVCPNIGEVATYKYDNHNKTNHISAPTFSQTFRWFREKYDLFTHIEKGENPKNFYPIIDNVSHKYNPKLWFDSYEDVELTCLTKLIEIVESKSELK
jgi:hypothetical protein